jgi:putative addiction module component (TIGR02574 family)
MSVSIESLGITQLSVADRLELIEQIWDNLPVEVVAADVPESHIAELAKRCASAQAQPELGKPWREVLDSIQGNQ